MMSSPRGPGPSTEPADGAQVEMDDGHVVGIAQSRSIERCGHGSVARCPSVCPGADVGRPVGLGALAV